MYAPLSFHDGHADGVRNCSPYQRRCPHFLTVKLRCDFVHSFSPVSPAHSLASSQLSRPQTVKRIWAYVKARELQDPSDKRQIRCDDALRAVFKADRVHMFTMNKILSTQMYDPEA